MRLTPTEAKILDLLVAAKGRHLNARTIRDCVMPGKHVNNVRVHINLMRSKGVHIATDEQGPECRGYRLEMAA
ncbi:helix-turn-helix domain-containing protein [Sphingobium sp. EP60837]|uniref:helix-turn-helix domain-containing protein n=1 Tax=Sphingobium sp. EP60837 TaxID=1855519 RepID=UPI0007DD3F16|nr:helix-turn-helix domain-containing protein [Sphingobium sp. EP60837]ANI79034.1 hypothetical protein EP837_02639 [Sphingobium sp. EP60837]